MSSNHLKPTITTTLFKYKLYTFGTSYNSFGSTPNSKGFACFVMRIVFTFMFEVLAPTPGKEPWHADGKAHLLASALQDEIKHFQTNDNTIVHSHYTVDAIKNA